MTNSARAGPRPQRAPDPFASTAALVGIAVLALLLRVLYLGKESLWWDEATSVAIAGSDWPRLLAALWRGEANMSLYYALLHMWMGLGRTEFVVRMLSVVFAAATVPAVYLVAARLFDRRTGLFASLLLALNVFHIHYAQEARSYALLVLLVTVASLVFVSALRRPSWQAWTLYTATMVLGIYSHFFAVFVLAAHWVSLALLGRRDVPWRFIVTSACVAGVLILPLVVFGLTKDQGQISWIPRPKLDAIPRLFSYLAGAAPSWEGPPVLDTPAAGRLFRATEIARRLLLLFYAGCVGAALVSAARLSVSPRPSAEIWGYAFLLLWLLVPPALAYLVSLVKPIFIYFYLITGVPPLTILAARGLSRIRAPATTAIALIVLAGLTAVQVAAYYRLGLKEDWRGATRYILSRARNGDGIIFATGSVTAYEFYRDRYRRAAPDAPAIMSLAAVKPGHPSRVWLILAHANERQAAAAEATVAAGRTLANNARFVGPISVVLYEAR